MSVEGVCRSDPVHRLLVWPPRGEFAFEGTALGNVNQLKINFKSHRLDHRNHLGPSYTSARGVRLQSFRSPTQKYTHFAAAASSGRLFGGKRERFDGFCPFLEVVNGSQRAIESDAVPCCTPCLSGNRFEKDALNTNPQSIGSLSWSTRILWSSEMATRKFCSK